MKFDDARDLPIRVSELSSADVSPWNDKPFQDVNRLEAWAALACDPAPNPTEQDLLPFLRPYVQGCPAEAWSDAEICEQMGLELEEWLAIREGGELSPAIAVRLARAQPQSFAWMKEHALADYRQRCWINAYLNEYSAAKGPSLFDAGAP